jgi:hypothetical protein
MSYLFAIAIPKVNYQHVYFMKINGFKPADSSFSETVELFGMGLHDRFFRC